MKIPQALSAYFITTCDARCCIFVCEKLYENISSAIRSHKELPVIKNKTDPHHPMVLLQLRAMQYNLQRSENGDKEDQSSEITSI